MEALRPVLLIVDDDEAFLRSISRVLRADYEVRTARTRSEAEASLSPPPDVVLLDLRLREEDPSNREGIEILRLLRERLPYVPVLMITAYGDIETAVECMRMGAVDFIQKARADIREIRVRLARALEQARTAQRVDQLEQEIALVEPRQIVGESAAIREVKRMIEALARDGRVTVLIRGETGTGKELVARAIHASGWRRSGPFVAVALAALPQTTVGAELFGYERGAFTDAHRRRIGYLEKAHRGVLFLDEIGDLPLETQVQLLRFLEEREFHRLGSTEPVRVDVQVLVATNADLEDLVRQGKFREDLYHRLKVCEIRLPPLRERPEDIPALVDHFLGILRERGRRVVSIAPDVLEALRRYDWPGNVRELRNVLEAAAFRAELRGSRRIELIDLPAEVRMSRSQTAPAEEGTVVGQGCSVYEALARLELSWTEQALQMTGGKKTEAWRLLGYHDRFTFTRRIRRLLTQYPHLGSEFPHVHAAFRPRRQRGGRED